MEKFTERKKARERKALYRLTKRETLKKELEKENSVTDKLKIDNLLYQ